MAKTWPIECDMRTLQVLEFCMHQMVGALQDEIADGNRKLRPDLKIAKSLLAEACKGQANLAVTKHVATRSK